MTRLHSHMLNIPLIMDNVYLCSPFAEHAVYERVERISRLGRAARGDSRSQRAETKISTKLPIPQWRLHMDSSCIGKRQTGEHPDRPGK
jgi:hypothetical protein